VLRLNETGQSDQLNCELLAIQFGPRQRAAKATSKPARTRKPVRDDKPGEEEPNRFDLEPRRVEAVGDPVVIRAPSRGGHARCQRLEYDLQTGRIVMEGNENIQLHQGQNELRTRRFDYRPGENGRLGWLQIAGPGWLQGALKDRPNQKYQAQWKDELRMRPQDQSQVVSIVGAAKVRYAEMGALSADEIHVWLLENRRPAPVRRSSAEVVMVNYRPGSTTNLPERIPPVAKPKKTSQTANIVPDRMLAEGHVSIDSKQLTGGTNRLEVWFQQADDASAGEPAATADRSSRSDSMLASRPPTQTFDVRGDLMRLQLRMRDKVTRVDDVSIEGHARLVETRTQKPGEAPLTVQGDCVQMARADSDESQVNVAGKPAMVEARGMALVGAKINLDRATNRLWIDGPGRMKLPMSRDLSGNALGQQQDLNVDWQGGMQFDGQTALFDRAVNARGEHQNLRTESLEVMLRKRVDFNRPQMPGERRERPAPGAGDTAEVERVACRGGVTIQNKTFDGNGQLSTEQMQMRDISINQVSGVIEGRGPGWITTVRRGGAGGLGFPGSTPAANPPSESKGYSFLNVRFEGPIGGNVHRQELSFSEQVRAVYGPVEAWTSELDPDAPDELDAQAVLLNCDKLIVRQMPAAVRGQRATVELETIGNTLVEGQTFTARAHKLSFAEAKDLLVLEGNGSTDAQLFRQAKMGGPTSQAAARRIMYWRNTNRVEVDDARFLDVGNLSGGKPNRSNNSGFPNLFPRQQDNKNPIGSGAQRSPQGNGTALPAFRR
jgi:lipopolysaccharide export system protein LptA